MRCLAGKGLVEADFHVVAQVGAALTASTAAARGSHAENAFKNIGKGRAEIGAEAMRPAAHAAMLEGRVAETVIGGALVAVLEHVIRLVDFLEAVLAVLVARIAIRVMLHGKLAERCLEFNLSAGAGYAQDLVVVALRHPDTALIHRAGTAVLDSATPGPCKDAPPDIGPGVATFANDLRMAPATQSGGFLFVVVDFGKFRVDHVFLLFR